MQSILNRAGEGRLNRGDRATKTKPCRYVRDHPGDLIHVDVKKIAGIPDGGGWWMHGRGYRGEKATKAGRAGYRYIHSALDDHSRIVYSEILDNEQAKTAADFWKRAAGWFESIGIKCHRVITDNGSCYRSGLWYKACKATSTEVKKTRVRWPQTNGKVERFHRILLEEWAYICPWTSETERGHAYQGFIHFYNHHRSHGSLKWATPIEVLKDNLPEEHT